MVVADLRILQNKCHFISILERKRRERNDDEKRNGWYNIFGYSPTRIYQSFLLRQKFQARPLISLSQFCFPPISFLILLYIPFIWLTKENIFPLNFNIFKKLVHKCNFKRDKYYSPTERSANWYKLLINTLHIKLLL